MRASYDKLLLASKKPHIMKYVADLPNMTDEDIDNINDKPWIRKGLHILKKNLRLEECMKTDVSMFDVEVSEEIIYGNIYQVSSDVFVPILSTHRKDTKSSMDILINAGSFIWIPESKEHICYGSSYCEYVSGMSMVLVMEHKTRKEYFYQYQKSISSLSSDSLFTIEKI